MPSSMLPVIEKLYWLKTELGTWNRVSAAIGINRSMIWDILNGRRDAGPKVLRKLYFAKTLELTDLDPQKVELTKIVRANYGT